MSMSDPGGPAGLRPPDDAPLWYRISKGEAEKSGALDEWSQAASRAFGCASYFLAVDKGHVEHPAGSDTVFVNDEEIEVSEARRESAWYWQAVMDKLDAYREAGR